MDKAPAFGADVPRLMSQGNKYVATDFTRLSHAKKLTEISAIEVKLSTIKVDKDNPFYIDIEVDISEKDYKNKVLILVDDVLNSGKTLMYGAKYFLSVPLKKLSTIVLVDRNHNRFPIKADFVGLSLSTTLKEHISVELEKNVGIYLS